jgi:hypothetical protein
MTEFDEGRRCSFPYDLGYQQIPNRLLTLVATLGPAKWAILLRVWRMTIGFGKERFTETRSQIADAVGLGKRTVDRHMKELVGRRLIHERPSGVKHRDFDIHSYAINMDGLEVECARDWDLAQDCGSLTLPAMWFRSMCRRADGRTIPRIAVETSGGQEFLLPDDGRPALEYLIATHSAQQFAQEDIKVAARAAGATLNAGLYCYIAHRLAHQPQRQQRTAAWYTTVLQKAKKDFVTSSSKSKPHTPQKAYAVVRLSGAIPGDDLALGNAQLRSAQRQSQREDAA